MTKNLLTLLLFCIKVYYLEAKQNSLQAHSVYCSEEKWKNMSLIGEKTYQSTPIKTTLCKTMQIRKAAEDKVGEFLKKRYCIGNNMISSYSKEAASAYEAQFGPKLEELEKLTAVLHNLVQEGPQTDNPKKLTTYQQRLTNLIKEITTGYTEICEAEQTLCGCYSG